MDLVDAACKLVESTCPDIEARPDLHCVNYHGQRRVVTVLPAHDHVTVMLTYGAELDLPPPWTGRGRGRHVRVRRSEDLAPLRDGLAAAWRRDKQVEGSIHDASV